MWEAARTPLGQDCADVAGTNLLLRSGCRNKVGTIPRSAQSAIAVGIRATPAFPSACAKAGDSTASRVACFGTAERRA
jgi:hypothetical protein